MSQENIYRQARLKAAEKNFNLSTIRDASMYLYISREKLAEIEQEDPDRKKRNPDIEDVINMVELYDAPELFDYYCTHQCPIRKGEKPLIHDSLSEISASLMSAMHFLGKADDSIHRILADSKITSDEQQEFERALETMKKVVYSINSLELWAQKNKLSKKQ